MPLKIGVHTRGGAALTFLAPATFHPFSLTSFSGPFLGMRGKCSSGCCRTRVSRQRRRFLGEPKNASPIVSVCSCEQYRSRRRECGNGIPCRRSRVRDVRPSCMHAATDLEQCGAARSTPAAEDGELSRHRATPRSQNSVSSYSSRGPKTLGRNPAPLSVGTTIGRKNSQTLQSGSRIWQPRMCPKHQRRGRVSAASGTRRRPRDVRVLPKGDGIARAKQAAYFL